jgi:hypothetical protein
MEVDRTRLIRGNTVRLKVRLICLGLLTILTTGCESTRWNWLKPGGGDAPTKGGASPNVAGLVQYLNENASRVRTVRVDDLSIDATMGSQTIGLRGRVYAEKPRGFRMKVTALGKEEVDIGSNAQEFWFWAAKNPDPYQYFCSYEDLNEGKVRMMPLPVQPEWVMEAMGLGPYGPAEKYKLESHDAQSIRLVEKVKSPQGYPVRKVIVMNRKEMRSPAPQVSAFLLLDDATGNEICSAHITSTTVDRTTGAILPYKMELRMPTQKMKMALKMDGMTVNAQIAASAFQRQPMTGIEAFNLATGKTEAFQRTQGFNK